MLVKSFTDDLAWDVQRQLVNGYFKTKETVKRALSPELQMLQGLLSQMVEKKPQIKLLQLQRTSKKRLSLYLITGVQKLILNSIAYKKGAGAEFKMLRTEMYTELERRAGCDLNTRLRNKRKRMAENGCTKTEINSLNKMDVIDDDKKLREIFSKIVTEYEIKYCA